ncbi:hypothetical protein [Mesorhizobium sp. KR2-14]|uniref:hypothetical protein n=1 Tax=Mesorhizobium sp. KR2-14 TaxID=3156610 RepID=UPI0032B6183D
MTMFRPAFYKLAFSTVFVAASLQGAHAQDASEVASRLKQLLAAQSMDLDWKSASGTSSEMVLQGVTVGIPGEAERFSIGSLTLEGVSEAGGSYKIETISTEPYHYAHDKSSVDISSLVLSGVVLPPEGATTDPLASMVMYQSAELASIEVKADGKDVFSLSNLSMEITPPKDGKAMEFTGSAEGFSADLTSIDDRDTRKVLDSLGYQQISGSIEMAGLWHPDDGRLALSQYDVTVENAGTFGMSFDIGGYTLAFMKSLQDVQKKMAELPEGADNTAQGFAMLGLMQQLTFKGASLRYYDDSLVGKVLNYLAEQQGVKPSDVANQTKAILPFMTAQLNNPELSGQITAAVNKFLDDPQSIEIKAAPASPVPFALLAASAMSAPLELPKTLGVIVKANED